MAPSISTSCSKKTMKPFTTMTIRSSLHTKPPEMTKIFCGGSALFQQPAQAAPRRGRLADSGQSFFQTHEHAEQPPFRAAGYCQVREHHGLWGHIGLDCVSSLLSHLVLLICRADCRRGDSRFAFFLRTLLELILHSSLRYEVFHSKKGVPDQHQVLQYHP